MAKQVLQIESIEANELLTRLDRMETAIRALSKQPKPTQEATPDYITRKEVAKLFKITLVTVNDWTNKGILIAYKIGNRVYYKRSEINEALTQKRGKYV